MEINTYFDILKILGKPTYENVSTLDKSRNFFMVNRHLIRLYPELCANFSQLKISTSAAMDFWHNYFKMIRAAKRDPLPSKINYTKVTHKSVKKKWTPESEEFMLNKLELGTKESNLIKKFGGKILIKYLKDVDSLINEKVKNGK